MTAVFAWAMPFGAMPLGRDRTRFRLWAPAQERVELQVEGGPSIEMTRSGDGWFEVEAPHGPGTRYRYRLGNGLAVPDPAARAQADDVHGPSVVVDPLAYRWQTPDWLGRPWHEAVIYELHVGAMGGFRGVERELPRLAALGVTAIELMPIGEFPGARNWGYDGTLPFAPEASYGTPEALKSLIDAAHRHGLSVLLDVVYNHFGPDGNYLGAYAPSMFREDIHTPWGPAIDFRVPEVRRFFIENALYWLMEYRFDGLRLDAAHAIADPGWLDEMAATVRATMEPGRHVHLVLEHDDNVAGHLVGGFDAQWNDDAHHVLHVLLTGERDGYYEDYDEAPTEALARSLAEGFVYQGQPSKHRGGKPRGTPSLGLPPTAFIFFLQNHDQIGNRAHGERLTGLSDGAALKAAIALQLLCPHVPLLFMGEENGSRSPFLFFTDHNDQLARAIREGRQREFAKFAAFAGETLPDPNAPATFEASIPRAGEDGRGFAELYRLLLRLRHREIVPRLAGAAAVDAVVVGASAVRARWRMGDGSLLTLIANLGRDDTETDMPSGRPLFGTPPNSRRLPACTTLAFLAEVP